jgi:hypothetical protein
MDIEVNRAIRRGEGRAEGERRRVLVFKPLVIR